MPPLDKRGAGGVEKRFLPSSLATAPDLLESNSGRRVLRRGVKPINISHEVLFGFEIKKKPHLGSQIGSVDHGAAAAHS